VRKASGIPCAIGFGISTPAQAAEMAALSDGAIVGSAIVHIIAEHGAESEAPVRAYVRAMKDALRAI
jgi:tryptophan synthase alpha chain